MTLKLWICHIWMKDKCQKVIKHQTECILNYLDKKNIPSTAQQKRFVSFLKLPLCLNPNKDVSQTWNNLFLIHHEHCEQKTVLKWILKSLFCIFKHNNVFIFILYCKKKLARISSYHLYFSVNFVNENYDKKMSDFFSITKKLMS